MSNQEQQQEPQRVFESDEDYEFRMKFPHLFPEDEYQPEEEEHEYEYENCGTEKEPLFGEVSYMVAGGGMMNGNAYATIELKEGIYYYCEYGKNASRQAVGNKIVWSDEIYDKKNPYQCRSFDIIDTAYDLYCTQNGYD